jgi:hypothetical protein
VQLVSGVGVPADAVFDTSDIQHDSNFEERGILQTIHHPGMATSRCRLACAGRRARRHVF